MSSVVALTERQHMALRLLLLGRSVQVLLSCYGCFKLELQGLYATGFVRYWVCTPQGLYATGFVLFRLFQSQAQSQLFEKTLQFEIGDILHRQRECYAKLPAGFLFSPEGSPATIQQNVVNCTSFPHSSPMSLYSPFLIPLSQMTAKPSKAVPHAWSSATDTKVGGLTNISEGSSIGGDMGAMPMLSVEEAERLVEEYQVSYHWGGAKVRTEPNPRRTLRAARAPFVTLSGDRANDATDITSRVRTVCWLDDTVCWLVHTICICTNYICTNCICTNCICTNCIPCIGHQTRPDRVVPVPQVPRRPGAPQSAGSPVRSDEERRVHSRSSSDV